MAQRICQLKITLLGTDPPVWRRVLVPEEATFAQLHDVLQAAMGWEDDHLHCFSLRQPGSRRWVDMAVGRPFLPFADEPEEEEEGISEHDLTLAEYFNGRRKVARYTYDFGDTWLHEVRLEQVVPREEGRRYPCCIDGARACPPEDCGGVWGYERICRGESDYFEDEDSFDPEHFSLEEVELNREEEPD
ncbi:MAG: plasmid pRiA4b ORF-3 family protein [Thermaerobacter sp.]|jgi:hypothetical protein|nr:plasmid pRiA4b ORF-3 family protein [Thermaerobacter sp.]